MFNSADALDGTSLNFAIIAYFANYLLASPSFVVLSFLTENRHQNGYLILIKLCISVNKCSIYIQIKICQTNAKTDNYAMYYLKGSALTCQGWGHLQYTDSTENGSLSTKCLSLWQLGSVFIETMPINRKNLLFNTNTVNYTGSCRRGRTKKTTWQTDAVPQAAKSQTWR